MCGGPGPASINGLGIANTRNCNRYQTIRQRTVAELPVVVASPTLNGVVAQ